MGVLKMPKFDIAKMNVDGETNAEEREYGVYASSRRELIELYALCGERARILKEYSDDELIQDTANITEDKIIHNVSPPPNTSWPASIPDEMNDIPETIKYFSIGDQKFKVVNNRLYTQDWVNYTGENIRIISEKTNKIIDMTNKIVQVKKWIEAPTEYSDCIDDQSEICDEE
jgi:hypothetical protein